MNKYDKTLEEIINEDQYTPFQAYNYVKQLCKGIEVLHTGKVPIIHRDLKPENILYDSNSDTLLISDFGLAHLEKETKTINQEFVGNIDYHAPEQKKKR